MAYVKLFKNHSEYEDTQAQDKGQISHCVEENEVHYGDIIPGNMIKYTASEQLPQNAYGLNFGGLTDEDFIGFTDEDLVSHTFVDGTGILEFDKSIYSIGYLLSFDCAAIESLTLPPSVEILNTLSNDALQNMTTLTILSTLPPDIQNSEYKFGFGNLTTIRVPSGVYNKYMESQDWEQYHDMIRPI